MKNLQAMILISIFSLFCLVEASFAAHTAFTYQGELVENGTKANGVYNFEFRLFDAVNGSGVEEGIPVELSSVPVVDGVFTVQLNFGDVWNGVDKFLQIAVAKPSDVDFTVLVPRQLINNTPMAIYALNAASFDGIGSDGFIKNSINEQASANFNISGTGKVNLLTAQAVGVGTTSPGARLTVSRPTQSASPQIELRNEGSIQAPNFDGIVFTQGVTGATELGSIKLKYQNNGRPDMSFSVRDRSNALYINGHNNNRGGNIGIGTTAPRSPLHISSNSDPELLITAKSSNGQDSGIAIVGAQNVKSSTDAAYIDLKDFDDDEAGGTEFSMARIGAGLAADAGQTGNLRFYTNDGSGLNEHMRIAKDGKVGLGTSLPSADLHLYSKASLQLRLDADSDRSGGSDQPSIIMTQNGGRIRGSIGYFDTSNNLSIRAVNIAGGSNLLLEPDSRVGIRTDNPQNTLDVRGPGTDSGGQSGLSEVIGRFVQTTDFTRAAVSIDAPNERDAILYLSEQGQASWDIRAAATGTRWSIPVFQIRSHLGGEDRVAFEIVDRDNGFFDVFPGVDGLTTLGGSSFSGGGWAAVYSYAYQAPSDARLKQDIQDLDYGIPDIMKLRAVRYQWKTRPEDGDHLGVIAQEVERIIPEIVSFDKEDEHKMRSVNYSSLIPVLIRGMQDQQNAIESITEHNRFLRQRIEDLEAVVDNLVAASSPGHSRNQ